MIKKADKDYYLTLIKMLKWDKIELTTDTGYKYQALLSQYNDFKLMMLYNPHGMATEHPFIVTRFDDGSKMWPSISYLDSLEYLIKGMNWIDSAAGAQYSVKVP